MDGGFERELELGGRILSDPRDLLLRAVDRGGFLWVSEVLGALEL